MHYNTALVVLIGFMRWDEYAKTWSNNQIKNYSHLEYQHLLVVYVIMIILHQSLCFSNICMIQHNGEILFSTIRFVEYMFETMSKQIVLLISVLVEVSFLSVSRVQIYSCLPACPLLSGSLFANHTASHSITDARNVYTTFGKRLWANIH